MYRINHRAALANVLQPMIVPLSLVSIAKNTLLFRFHSIFGEITPDKLCYETPEDHHLHKTVYIGPWILDVPFVSVYNKNRVVAGGRFLDEHRKRHEAVLIYPRHFDIYFSNLIQRRF